MKDQLPLIRRRIAVLDGRARRSCAAEDSFAPTGHIAIDRTLGGGLLRGRVHELLASEEECGSSAVFAGILAQRCGGAMLWLREAAVERQVGMLHAAGLAQIGLDPGRLILGRLPDAVSVMRAAVDALRCPALGSVIVEVKGDPRSLDLTASRRMALAAETSGVTALLLKIGGLPLPSAAQTRWRMSAAPSLALAANAPGYPAWDVELLRQRGRVGGGRWRVEWDREQERLCSWEEGSRAALPRAMVPFSVDRPPGGLSAL